MPIGSLLFLFVRDCASVCFYSLCTNFCSSLFTLSLGCAISFILFDFQVTLNCTEIPFDIRLSIRRINIRLLFISFLSICFFEENLSSVCDCFFVCSGKKSENYLLILVIYPCTLSTIFYNIIFLSKNAVF